MNQLLPDIEDLANCQTHAERCDWLLRAPLSVLLKYEMTIRNRLMHARFAEGIAYLEAMNALSRSPRGGDGNWSVEIRMRHEVEKCRLVEAANPPQSDGAAPVPDHSITEI